MDAKFVIKNNAIWCDGEKLSLEEVLAFLINQYGEIERLKCELTFYQYENEKHIEARKLMLEKISELQNEIALSKTDKEKQLEKELYECEKFRHSVFSAVERMAKWRGTE